MNCSELLSCSLVADSCGNDFYNNIVTGDYVVSFSYIKRFQFPLQVSVIIINLVIVSRKFNF